ncbi:2,5-dichloro-2,5-cyclohexadiene-1,4-diol dehydrogenase [Frankia canadensis]|uniref:2,5-dichloro-2,5-cyclohexadiene-1,4-diol dehydrogenase n=1 Tax=Frankia canadensis TaxID=1836972 RepID=A0A2I2KI32_9ACTN|nr:SDR family oxidoreductase [Frankia canadensis]SNQ45330.1 2,5-dichloro-2,5-cyclohexadiene-1,4-diol dehydrogenase [Frankia canadensis]SOU52620.1 2,5-dichloro-2,5-cyclohexadiene-1,4-diol dehydrogenase [Frankia canadensis]
MLENKIGYVTGGASGLGEATVRRLAADGAAVVIADVNKERGDLVAAELKEQGARVAFVETDVRVADDVDRLIRTTVDTFGGLNYAVNNAGYGHGVTKLHETDIATFDDQVAVNLRGAYLGTRAAVIHMRENGGGSIVNIASLAGVRGVAGTAAYGAAKHGVIGLSRAAALDYVRDGIRINVVAPGAFLTPLMESRGPELIKHWSDAMPSGRLGEPRELANAVVWLVSDESSYVSGVTLSVDYAAHQA